MIYPEIFSQACAERMFLYDPQNKIFGQLHILETAATYYKIQQGK